MKRSNKTELLRDLGEKAYAWHEAGQIKFTSKTDLRDFESEWTRLSTLIRYVHRKKDHLLRGIL